MLDPLAEVLSAAEKHAGRAFLIIPGRSALTFAQFRDHALGLAGWLAASGLSRGDRVLALVESTPEHALLFFACLFLGATVVPVNPALHAGDIAIIRAKAKAKLELRPPPMGDAAYRAAFAPPALAGGEWLTIVFTSGTTAFPKAVAHKAASLVGNALAFNEAMGNGPADRFLHLFPMAYSGGFFNLLLAPFLAGSSVVLTPGFGPRTALDFWSLPRAHGVNALWLSPTIAAALLAADRDEAGRAWCRQSVKKAFIGTAPLHVSVKRAFEAAYGVVLFESYGLSETLLAAALGPRTGAVEGAVGAPLPGVGIEIRDGEVFIKSPHMMAGYLDLETGEAKPPPEWFATGDLGELGQDGLLRVTGRKKDLIIRAGLNVSPLAVESALLEHEAVAQAAVVGVPHAFLGEDVVAVVRPRPGASRAELERWCRGRFAPVNRPSAVLLLDEFPTGVTGKVLKAKLRDWAAGELAR